MSLPFDDVRKLVGRTAVYTAPEELGRALVRQFALGTGDDNPLYSDADLAKAWGHDDVVVPPTLICDTNQYTGLLPDADGFPGHSWGIEIPGTRKIRGGNAYTFHRPVHPGDVVTAHWTLTGVKERTNAAGRAMLIVTSVVRYTNQHGDALADNEETVIWAELPSAPSPEGPS
ncbi:MaoC family dehydratase [Yinghuangia soli]|uniref:MaoC family dehydratase N-terminal domain-containing protein n=1 Tax=Yinghuangia soli TaxID=2908204 RepID=A0AA41PX82_9ACTN|nr:MaoC family dehydratase N-terminal domain-containing protein [Yinghuangia soli]MCF2526494.1 MaoC family dehydratase N-terminal domain-containing protein [Yinghuangia soli]